MLYLAQQILDKKLLSYEVTWRACEQCVHQEQRRALLSTVRFGLTQSMVQEVQGTNNKA